MSSSVSGLEHDLVLTRFGFCRELGVLRWCAAPLTPKARSFPSVFAFSVWKEIQSDNLHERRPPQRRRSQVEDTVAEKKISLQFLARDQVENGFSINSWRGRMGIPSGRDHMT